MRPLSALMESWRLSVHVALERSLALMVKLVQAPLRPMHIVQPPPAGPMKWSTEPKNAF